MKKAKIFVNGTPAGELHELVKGKIYEFIYDKNYSGPSVSLEMPIHQQIYRFDRFPPFFEGLLPEGSMLEGLLKYSKINSDDLMTQLITVGQDLVGNITVEEIDE